MASSHGSRGPPSCAALGRGGPTGQLVSVCLVCEREVGGRCMGACACACGMFTLHGFACAPTHSQGASCDCLVVVLRSICVLSYIVCANDVHDSMCVRMLH